MYIHLSFSLSLYIYIYIHIYLYLSIYIYTIHTQHTHTHRQGKVLFPQVPLHPLSCESREPCHHYTYLTWAPESESLCVEDDDEDDDDDVIGELGETPGSQSVRRLTGSSREAARAAEDPWVRPLSASGCARPGRRSLCPACPSSRGGAPWCSSHPRRPG